MILQAARLGRPGRLRRRGEAVFEAGGKPVAAQGGDPAAGRDARREKSDLGVVFHDLAERFKKRGVVAVFSDLFDDVEKVVSGLKHFRHRRHEVIVFHILDPAEIEFPFRDTTLFKGLEDASQVLTDPHALRRAYQEEVTSFLKQIEKGLPDGRHRLCAACAPTRTSALRSRATWRRGRPGFVRTLPRQPDQRAAGLELSTSLLSGPWVLPTCRCSMRWRRRRCRW